MQKEVINLIKCAKKSLLIIIEKIQKYRKCPALQLCHVLFNFQRKAQRACSLPKSSAWQLIDFIYMLTSIQTKLLEFDSFPILDIKVEIKNAKMSLKNIQVIKSKR